MLTSMFTVLGVAALSALWLCARLPRGILPAAGLMLAGAAMVLVPDILHGAGRPGSLTAPSGRGWLGLAAALGALACTVAYLVLLQARRRGPPPRGPGFDLDRFDSAARTQPQGGHAGSPSTRPPPSPASPPPHPPKAFKHARLDAVEVLWWLTGVVLLAVLPLSLIIDGPDWGAQLRGFGRADWAALLFSGCVAHIGSVLGIQREPGARGSLGVEPRASAPLSSACLRSWPSPCTAHPRRPPPTSPLTPAQSRPGSWARRRSACSLRCAS
jgi:hypothetical protein